MPFANQVAAGKQLVRRVLQSAGFVAGVTGWQLQRNGDAEFNDLTARGTIIGATIENSATDPKTSINPDGSITITNAAGGVIFDLAANGVMTWSDPAGNPLVRINPGTATIIVENTSQLRFPTNAAFENQVANLTSDVVGSPPADFAQTVISGPSTTTAGAHDWVQIQLNSAAADNSSSANMEFIYVDTGGTPHLFAHMDSTGFHIP